MAKRVVEDNSATWELHACIEHIVYIKDLNEDGKKSVTNDAENVFKALQENPETAGKRVVYQDTMGHWDEIKMTAEGKAVFHPWKNEIPKAGK